LAALAGTANIGCFAHVFALLLKDLAKNFEWVKECYDAGIDISTAVNNSEKILVSLKQSMLALPGAIIYAIDTHVDPRFGSKHLVLRSCMRAQAALMHMCGKQPFRELCLDSSSGKSASKLHGIITNIGI
jgi:hypothetical protein